MLTEDEIVLRELPAPDLLRHRVAGYIDVDVHATFSEYLLHFADVVIDGWHYRDDERLSGAQPEWPL